MKAVLILIYISGGGLDRVEYETRNLEECYYIRRYTDSVLQETIQNKFRSYCEERPK